VSRPAQELAFTQDEPAELKRARTMHITFDRGCPETPTECGLRFRLVEDYARRNGFPNPIHFTDDGISGTRFDCPGFTAMMEGGGGRERGCYHCERWLCYCRTKLRRPL